MVNLGVLPPSVIFALRYMYNIFFFLSDKPLGSSVLGGFMFAKGIGKDHWEEIKKNEKLFIQRWHPLADSAAKGGGGDQAGGKGRKGKKNSL